MASRQFPSVYNQAWSSLAPPACHEYHHPSPKFDFIGVKAVADQSGVQAVPNKPFLTDIKTLRERARKHIEQGAVTEGYTADRDTVVKILNEALATEIVCVLRYKRHYFMASGINAESVATEFLQHANEEQGHADLIAQRIVQLGGAPNFNPDGLTTRSHAEYVEGETLIDMIKEDLVAERIAIDSYREMINYVNTDDPTTRRMLEGILAMEEEHADDLNNLLEKIGT
ncbi:MAG TPA: bacterioferritin [Blastocatellia bacterium]|nr:bacterioferritin [Blastocatellia bacterium]